MHELARRVVGGDTRALARVCRLIDDGIGPYRSILRDLFPHTGGTWTVGVTGTPGAGKSTLTDRLIELFREAGERVGVLAIDPTSPFSGGAILGDRIRMQRHFEDRGVFIRSLATRGTLGGLSRSAPDVMRAIEAWQPGVVIVETVGVGQDELEVTRTVDSTLVVMAPGMGDEVQAIKAGIMECADVFAVNKADREGADATARQVEMMIGLGQEVRRGVQQRRGHIAADLRCGAAAEREIARRREAATRGIWVPPVKLCQAHRGVGIDALLEALREHRVWLEGTDGGKERRRQRLREAMRHQLREQLIEAALEKVEPALDGLVDEVAARRTDPYTASERLISMFRGT